MQNLFNGSSVYNLYDEIIIENKKSKPSNINPSKLNIKALVVIIGAFLFLSN
jgi:hypothetical protein